MLNNSNRLIGPYINLLHNPEFPLLISMNYNKFIKIAHMNGVATYQRKRIEIINDILSH